MRSKFGWLVGTFLWAAGVLPVVAGGVPTHFTLLSVGNANCADVIRVKDSEKSVVERLRQTEYGQALLMVPHYFLGEMKPLWGEFAFDTEGKVVDYGIRLRFSALQCQEWVRKDNLTKHVERGVRHSLVMNAVVSAKDCKNVYASNFDEGIIIPSYENTMNSQSNICDRLVRKCLSGLAQELKVQFSKD